MSAEAEYRSLRDLHGIDPYKAVFHPHEYYTGRDAAPNFIRMVQGDIDAVKQGAKCDFRRYDLTLYHDISQAIPYCHGLGLNLEAISRADSWDGPRISYELFVEPCGDYTKTHMVIGMNWKKERTHISMAKETGRSSSAHPNSSNISKTRPIEWDDAGARDA